MRFGGLVAVDDVSFAARQREITAIIGPNGAGKTTVFNCLTGFYKPTVGRLTLFNDGRPAYLLEQMDGFRIAQEGRRRAHVPEHPPVRRHVGAGEPDRGAAQQADAGLGLHGRWACSACRAIARAEQAAIEKARLLARARRADRPCRLGRRQPALWRRSAGWRSRAPCAPSPCCCASTSRPPGLNPRESAELNELLLSIRDEYGIGDAADRARHERGHGHLRPHRRARLRPQDLRRHAGRSAAPIPRSSAPISARRRSQPRPTGAAMLQDLGRPHLLRPYRGA